VTKVSPKESETGWTRQSKRVWREIGASPSPMAVLVLDSKVRAFPLTVDVGEMMADLPDQTVGVFDARYGYAAFLDDVLFTVRRLERV
jgi:hypothetical protein